MRWNPEPIHTHVRSSHLHAVQAIWRLFETVALPQVIINLAVFHARVRGLAPSGDLPHGDSKRPLGERDGGPEVVREEEQRWRSAPYKH